MTRRMSNGLVVCFGCSVIAGCGANHTPAPPPQQQQQAISKVQNQPKMPAEVKESISRQIQAETARQQNAAHQPTTP